MKSSFLLIIICLNCCLATKVRSQELYIHADAASPVPRGVFSFRYSMEAYQEEYNRKHWHALRLYYGISNNLSVTGSLTASNHHLREFPANPYAYFTNHHQKGFSRDYPLNFDGGHVNLRYRLFSHDEPNGHIRIAAFAEGSYINSAHDEAEPHLLGDNTGYGGGIIATQLIKKLALNVTAGLMRPTMYHQKKDNLKFRSGNARYVIFSAGYLLYPKAYNSYNDLNINIYMEALYKEYDAATLYINEQHENIEFFPYLREGRYMELRPGLQFIMNSRNRLDISAGITVYGRTFIRYNPTVYINYQRYLFK